MASVTELQARQTEIKSRLAELDAEHAGDTFPDDARSEWNDLNEELEQNEKRIGELTERMNRLRDLADDPARTESAQMPNVRRDRNTGHARRVPDDPTQMHEYRKLSTSMDDLEQAYRDGAMEIIEKSNFAHPDADREEQQGHIGRMLDTIDVRRGEDGPRSLARRVIMTSSKAYGREFGRYLSTGVVGEEMLRAASLTTTAGGFAVPVTLDPTVILTSSGVMNPVRQLARVVRTTGNTWEGISSTGITAAYSDEATEATDNTPVLAQPTANVEKAQAFVPFSIEIGEDWAGIQSEMAMMLQDAKDKLESSKFLTGAGHGSHVPEGLLTGATASINTAATATFAVADLYSLENALSPRWKTRASIIANRAYFNKVRQFDTAGGASLWVQLQDGQPERLIGYPKYEWSDMSSAATSATPIMTIGDFNQFLIVDRVGMNIELIPHIFGTVSNFPTGSRGLYCYWRNTSKVLAGGLQANSAFVTLKLL